MLRSIQLTSFDCHPLFFRPVCPPHPLPALVQPPAPVPLDALACLLLVVVTALFPVGVVLVFLTLIMLWSCDDHVDTAAVVVDVDVVGVFVLSFVVACRPSAWVVSARPADVTL